MTDAEMIATARFDACERHPDFTKAMTATPPASQVSKAAIVPAVMFLLFFCGVGAFILYVFLSIAPLPMVLFAVGVIGFGAFSVGKDIIKPFLRARATGTVERCLAVVAEISGGRVTLAYRDGKRRDVSAPELALTRGDIGVGYIRDGALAGFVPLA